MDSTMLKIIESLRSENPTLDSLMNTHHNLNDRVDDLNGRSHLSEEENLDLMELKKEKLKIRDQIQGIVKEQRSA